MKSVENRITNLEKKISQLDRLSKSTMKDVAHLKSDKHKCSVVVKRYPGKGEYKSDLVKKMDNFFTRHFPSVRFTIADAHRFDKWKEGSNISVRFLTVCMVKELLDVARMPENKGGFEGVFISADFPPNVRKKQFLEREKKREEAKSKEKETAEKIDAS
uniref:Uncharacterized protein n=1 Tax=Ditylenchus dipsaci TaxID=166011 RepID=A0A915DA37_9BILA